MSPMFVSVYARALGSSFEGFKNVLVFMKKSNVAKENPETYIDEIVSIYNHMYFIVIKTKSK